MIKITYEQVKEYVEGELDKGCKLLTTEEEFKEERSHVHKIASVKLIIQCRCSNIFIITYGGIKRGEKSCMECSFVYNNKEKALIQYNKIKNTINETKGCKLLTSFEEFFDILHIEKMSTDKIKLRITCRLCGNEYIARFNNFKNGNKKQCNNCGNKMNGDNKRKSINQFKKEVYKLVGNEYEVLGEYINTNTNILFKHNCDKCNNNEFLGTPSNFLKGNRCPICAGIGKKTTEQFKQEVFNLVGDEYTVLGEYEGRHYKILMVHNSDKCGSHEFYMTPNNFIYGNRCPKCKKSKGEAKIEEYLTTNNIFYQNQHKFNDCIDKKVLPFDFSVFNKDNELNYIIEYDGRLHYEPYRKIDKALEKFETTKYHDKIKNEYCINNNISLIRIPYWDFKEIDIILDDILMNDNINSLYIVNNKK